PIDLRSVEPPRLCRLISRILHERVRGVRTARLPDDVETCRSPPGGTERDIALVLLARPHPPSSLPAYAMTKGRDCPAGDLRRARSRARRVRCQFSRDSRPVACTISSSDPESCRIVETSVG